MSVPDHQLDPPDEDGWFSFTDCEGKHIAPPDVVVGIDLAEADVSPGRIRSKSTQQILEIFQAPFPQEEWANAWWQHVPDDLFTIPDSHEKRTRYYLEKYPWWKLWKINQKLEEEKLSPTIDHERSEIVIGKSKAAAAYVQHNDNFKRFIEELIP